MSTAIKSRGEGRRTTSHLNLTKTLADVWGVSVAPVVVADAIPAPRRRQPRPFKDKPGKVRFAGYDNSEVQFKWVRNAEKGVA